MPRCTACAFLRGWWCLFGQTIVISSAYGSYPHSRMPRAGHAASTSAVCARRGKARTTDTPTHDPDTRQSRRLLYSYFQAGPGTDPPARLQRSSSEASSLAALHRTCSRTARHSAGVGESEGVQQHLASLLAHSTRLTQNRTFSDIEMRFDLFQESETGKEDGEVPPRGFDHVLDDACRALPISFTMRP